MFITGDIHGNPFRLSAKKFPLGKKLTKDDYIIIAGDFGVIWDNYESPNELYTLKWLQDKPWTTLFIDGNHENHFRLKQIPEIDRFEGKVGKLRDGVYHLKRGETYILNGKSFFCFGGALSHDRMYRKLGVSYWEEEIPNYSEMDYGLQNLQKCQYSVDYIVSHTIPRSLFAILGFNKYSEDPTIKYLDHIANSVQYKKWYFGHMHINKRLGKFRALYEDIEEII